MDLLKQKIFFFFKCAIWSWFRESKRNVCFIFFRWIYALTSLFTSWQTRYLHIIRLWPEGEYVFCGLDMKPWVAWSDIHMTVRSKWETSSLPSILVCFLINGYDLNARIKGQRSTSRHLTAMRHCSNRGMCRWARPLLGVAHLDSTFEIVGFS